MTRSEPSIPDRRSGDHDRISALSGRWQHPLVMAVYVSVVLLAELGLLPDDYAVGGTRQPPLEVIVWSTVVGLAVAHWFAFGVVAAGIGAGRWDRAGLRTATSEFMAAVAVGVLSSVAVLFAPEERDVGAAALGPAVMLAVTGYFVARAGRRSKPIAVLVGVSVLGVGLLVAGFKARIGFH